MTPRMSLGLFVAAALTLIAAVGFVAHAEPDPREHEAFVTTIVQRHVLDQDVARHVLEARFAFSSNYDALAKDYREARRLTSVLEHDQPSFMRPAERQDFVKTLSGYAKLSQEREQLVEQFKSENALLRNSVKYFPKAAEAALAMVHDPALRDQLIEHRRLTFSLALDEDDAARAAQQGSSEAIREATRGKLTPEQMRSTASMLAHSSAITKHKVATDQLLRRLLALPLDSALKPIGSSYTAAFARAQGEIRVVTHFVSGLALVLLCILAHAGLRLRQAAQGLRRANEHLEEAVLARTAELESEMARRARMEVELRQAQKLEAVGQLASGIAHEINTPIQYVGDSIYFLREAFADVMRLVEAYAKLAAEVSNSARGPALAEVTLVSEEVDVDMLRAEVPEAFERTADGARQVASIVKAMKTFAHTSAEKAPLDLNAAIENTLTVARNEYKYVADLTLELGDIPNVTCNAGGVRQVLINLLVNAAHAIADANAGTDKRGSIRISTEQRESDVLVAIADTGSGIPEAVRARIFEPFFTTKEPGRGTGQGLAISQSLVKQHAGKLWFETELGVGTTFFMQLPIRGLVESDGSECAA